MKYLVLIIVSSLLVCSAIAQDSDMGDDFESGDMLDLEDEVEIISEVVDEDLEHGEEIDDQVADGDQDVENDQGANEEDLYTASGEDGIEKRSVSGAIESITGLNNDVTVKDARFTTLITSKSFSAGQLDELLSTVELFDFLLNEKLRKYHNLASKIYGERFGDRPIQIMFMDENINVMDNELRICHNLTVIETYLKPVKEQIKALKVNFIALDDDLPAALTFICNSLSKTLKSLEISGSGWHDLEPFKKSIFPALEELSIFGSNIPEDKKLNFKKIFPNVNRLAKD